MEVLQTYLEQHFKTSVAILSHQLLSGGACQDNFLLKIEKNNIKENVVLRTDRGGSLLSSLNRLDEYAVAELAFQNEVLTPEPLWTECENMDIFGHPFVFFRKIDGTTDPRTIMKDKNLAEARDKLPLQLATELSKIHSIKYIPYSEFGSLPKPVSSEDYAKESVKDFLNEVDKLPERHPVFESAAAWMLDNLPGPLPLVLVHGDYRMGNFMVDDSGLTGVLDWEFAHWGDPAEDIAWMCLRDWRFGQLKKECAGITSRENFEELYSKQVGDFEFSRVKFWEVMGNARWALGTLQQTNRVLEGKAKGVELLAIGRRCCEMEYEMMRLIYA
jgi:aminoglycoside phosphotransferase (APT) family kinase protein